MGNWGMEWGECWESRWECRETGECGEWRWKCGESGGIAWNQGENAGNRGGNVGNLGGNAGNQGRNVGNHGGNARNQDGNARNQGGNEGNQCDSSWEPSCLLLWLKSQSARGAFHHPAFIGSYPIVSHKFFALSTKWSSPSRKWGRGVSPKCHLLVFLFGLNQENYDAGGVQDSLV